MNLQETPDPLPFSWKTAFSCLFLVLLAVYCGLTFLTSAPSGWHDLAWVENEKVFWIDDAYRFFIARAAFHLPGSFLFGYTFPAALFGDAVLASLLSGNLLLMRTVHLGAALVALFLLFRIGRSLNCDPPLILFAVLLVGSMPLYVYVSASFLGESCFGLLIVLTFFSLVRGWKLPTAILASLLPLTRLEGVLYVFLFFLFFALRKDKWKCLVVVAPLLAYLCAMLVFQGGFSSFLSWRWAFRNYLAAFPDQGLESSLAGWLGTFNPVWMCPGLAAVFLPPYRRWWPILLGPHLLIPVLFTAIGLDILVHQIRFFAPLVPVLGLAWILPFQFGLDNCRTAPQRRTVRLLAALVFLIGFALNLGQADLGRQVCSPRTAPRKLADPYMLLKHGDLTVYDPAPLRSFAGEVDRYLSLHPEVKTVFIENIHSLYFLNFFQDGVPREVVLLHPNRMFTRLTGGFRFGVLFRSSGYGYFRFDPVNGKGDPLGVFVGDWFPPSQEPEIKHHGFKAYRVRHVRLAEAPWDLRMEGIRGMGPRPFRARESPGHLPPLTGESTRNSTAR